MAKRYHKRYGPVHKRGVRVPLWQRKEPAPVKSYIVHAKTICHVRKFRTTAWREHKTRTGIVCHGYLWRNASHYGLAYGEWEIKVRAEYVREVKHPLSHRFREP